MAAGVDNVYEIYTFQPIGWSHKWSVKFLFQGPSQRSGFKDFIVRVFLKAIVEWAHTQNYNPQSYMILFVEGVSADTTAEYFVMLA